MSFFLATPIRTKTFSGLAGHPVPDLARKGTQFSSYSVIAVLRGPTIEQVNSLICGRLRTNAICYGPLTGGAAEQMETE